MKEKLCGELMIYFDDIMEQFVYEANGLRFVWDEEPTPEQVSKIAGLTQAYYDRLPYLEAFMRQDLEEWYGPQTIESIRENLGRPTIDDLSGRISYLEHTFDDSHILDIEYLGEGFTDLYLFGIDG